MTSASEFSVKPLTPLLGAEISNVDLTMPDPLVFEKIEQAWLKYKVVFVYDQRLDLTALCRFSSQFGVLMQLPYIKPVDDFPEVICVRKEATEIDMGVFGGDWHTDFSFLAEPPKASILYSEVIPPVGGDTLWVDMAHAWKTLPSTIRDKLIGRYAIHTGAPYGVRNAPDKADQFKGSIEIERGNPEADAEVLHPAVCRHPHTGEEMLFVNPTYTTGFEGMMPHESSQLLSDIYLHCMRPEFSCRFRWRVGTVVIWDNRNTMHYAVNDYDGYQRVLYRTTVMGQTPIPA